jgi:predicted CXXCH cytochrome family protein
MLLTGATAEVCGSCHEEVGERLIEKPNKHGPVADNDCAACHTTHGGQQPLLLVEYFPEDFYNAYAESLYDLCFMCHNADIARDAETTTLTDFRDGKQNLHYLHVNRRKGRSCKACHAVHASHQQKHIRHSVPFGRMYEYPVEFTTHDDGGHCLVGCHKQVTYDRNKKG